MTIYECEYECDSCRRRFERKQSIHDKLESKCPECGGSFTTA